MKSLSLLPLVFLAFFSGCSQPEPVQDLSVVKDETRFNIISQWRFHSRVPVESYFTNLYLCWLDEKKLVARGGGKQHQLQEGTKMVAGNGETAAIPFRETDHNRGRLAFLEVIVFTLEDGTVEQRSFLSNVIESPRKERHIMPSQSVLEELSAPFDPTGSGL
ncbi:MAG: hypothetical protein P1U85_12900 [Verrucomicrobiales bacterium]|jgi:hypothetical protein|nr:hypothetical protein [Verrucomicrobiales bacterium]